MATLTSVGEMKSPTGVKVVSSKNQGSGFRRPKRHTEAIGFEEKAKAAAARLVLYSKHAKFEDISYLYQNAADRYRIVRKWRKAGECYAKAGDAEKTMENWLHAAAFYMNAAESFYYVDPSDAIKFYLAAISQYTSIGRFGTAAKCQVEIAKLYEQDEALEDAAGAFLLAADFYHGEDMTTQAVLCLEKAGAYLAVAGRYDEAVERFEVAAQDCLDVNMLKFNAPHHMLMAVLCWIASGNLATAQETLLDCQARDFVFPASRQGLFAADVLTCAAKFDLDTLVDHIWNYDSVEPLDPRQLVIMQRIVELVKAGPPASVHSSEDEYSDEGSEGSESSSEYSDWSTTSSEGSAASTRSGGTTGTAGTATTGTAPTTRSRTTTAFGGRTSVGGGTTTVAESVSSFGGTATVRSGMSDGGSTTRS